jgi:tRNA A-37 threonylcarbamoyl transferase component Bud32
MGSLVDQQEVGQLRIDGFSELVPIGSGAESMVFRAVQDRFGRPVAIKVMNVRLDDHGSQTQFDAECQALGRLAQHPNVVTVHDAGLIDGVRPYLVMELCELGSLGARLERDGPLGADEVLDVGIKVSSALGAAHELGIVHGDMKPANILETAYEPKLADFGISVVQEARDRTRTIQGLTPVHAAPEMLENHRVGRRSDVYSLASSMFELIAGRPAFAAENGSLLTLMFQISSAPVPDLSLDGTAPEPLMAALTWAMAKDPQARPASAEDFAARLQSVQRQLGYAPTAVQTRAERLRTEATRRQLGPTVQMRAADVAAITHPSDAAPSTEPASSSTLRRDRPARRPGRRLAALGALAAVALLLLGALVLVRAASSPSPSLGRAEAVGVATGAGACETAPSGEGITVDAAGTTATATWASGCPVTLALYELVFGQPVTTGAPAVFASDQDQAVLSVDHAGVYCVQLAAMPAGRPMVSAAMLSCSDGQEVAAPPPSAPAG